MNTKELSELRRRWKPDRLNSSHIYGCFVNKDRQIVSTIDESLNLLPHEETEQYVGLLKKTLSGGLGRNLLQLSFTTQQVVDGEEHKLLSALRNSKLQESNARELFFQRVIDSVRMDESYLILLAADSYDVPYRTSDDLPDAEQSDEVFNYFLCAVCPVKEAKNGLGFFPSENRFHCSSGMVVSAPEIGFLFPAFNDRAADLYSALYYSRSVVDIHEDFIEAIFHTDIPMAPEEQKDSFKEILVDALENACDIETVQAIHKEISEKMAEHKESKDPEPFTMTSKQLADVLMDCEVPEERLEVFQKGFERQFGEGATVSPANIFDSKKLEVQTSQVRITVDPEAALFIKTQMVDGRRYILIPAEDGMEVNGFPVKLSELPEA